jgi:short-subunit dehydrogenase
MTARQAGALVTGASSGIGKEVAAGRQPVSTVRGR